MAAALAAALGLKVSGDKLKKKAAGGPVLAGQTYLVGELGPELFTATQNGHITTAAQTQQIMAGGGSTVYNLHVDGRRVGMDPRLEQAVRTIVDVAADAGNLRNAGY